MKLNKIQAVMPLGRGTRIENKPFVRIDGRELFLYGYEILTELFDNVLIVCRNDVFGILKDYKIKNVISENKNIGPVGGIYEGAKNLKSEYVFVAGCDMPFLNSRVIEFLCSLVEGDGIVPVHENGNLEPLHSIYRREKMIEVIEKIGDERRISKVIEKMNVRFIPAGELRVYDKELLTFRNINTMDDVAWMEDYLNKIKSEPKAGLGTTSWMDMKFNMQYDPSSDVAERQSRSDTCLRGETSQPHGSVSGDDQPFRRLNLNEKSFKILEKLKGIEGVKAIEFNTEAGKITIIDLGVNSKLEDKIPETVGISVAESSMGGLGRVSIKNNRIFVDMEKEPAVAALSCQLAGWGMEINGKKALGSGPARIPAKKPSGLIDRIGYHEISEKSALILETEILPDEKTCKRILEETNSDELIIAAFRDKSMAGLINVIARVVEVGLYRLDRVGYNVNKVISARGNAPIPRITEDIMFTSNDAIIYGGIVEIKVNDWDENLTEKAVSLSSRVYGKTFKSLFQEARGDFYRIDPEIFAPAELTVTDVAGNREYHTGRVNDEILRKIL